MVLDAAARGQQRAFTSGRSPLLERLCATVAADAAGAASGGTQRRQSRGPGGREGGDRIATPTWAII